MTLKTTIEEINGELCTVIWHEPLVSSEEMKSVKLDKETLLDPKFVQQFSCRDGVIITRSRWEGIHVATALPALPRNPKPEDARLLYRYMSEEIEFVFKEKNLLFDSNGNNHVYQESAVVRNPYCQLDDVYWLEPVYPEITHAIDSETEERVEIAIKENE